MTAADLARELGVPLTEAHRRLHGYGKVGGYPLLPRPCCLCGVETLSRGGTHAFCDPCRKSHFAAQSRAGLEVRKAIRAGQLPPAKEQTCTDCGSPAAHYDHRDYSKPLDVQAVCRSCNYKRGPATHRKAA